MRGICCECQTEQDLRYSPARRIDCETDQYVMAYHLCAGQPCKGAETTPQAIVTKPQIYRSCIQCRDHVSGKIGDFIHQGDFNAISPVFTNILDMLRWMKTNGYEEQPFVNGNGYDPFRVVKSDKVLI